MASSPLGQVDRSVDDCNFSNGAHHGIDSCSEMPRPYPHCNTSNGIPQVAMTMQRPPQPCTPPHFPIAPYNMPSYPAKFGTPRREGGQPPGHEDTTPNSRAVQYGSHVGRVNRPVLTATPMSAEKSSKGLRHFALRVCQKVKQKGVTSYMEVAEELVQELATLEGLGRSRQAEGQPYENKNIRRRVYDALNVLMAMKIISKEKKEIRWIGLPTTCAQEYNHLREKKKSRMERIKKKRAHLYELIIQQVVFKNLTRRNKSEEGRLGGAPDAAKRIQLPFIIVNTGPDTQIDCEMADDGTEFFFEFNQPFEIHDEIEVLKRLHLAEGLDSNQITPQSLAAVSVLLPPEVQPHVHEMARRINAFQSDTDTGLPSSTLDQSAGPPQPVLHPRPIVPGHSQPQPNFTSNTSSYCTNSKAVPMHPSTYTPIKATHPSSHEKWLWANGKERQ